MGDDGRLYVAPDIPPAFRDLLLPLVSGPLEAPYSTAELAGARRRPACGPGCLSPAGTPRASRPHSAPSSPHPPLAARQASVLTPNQFEAEQLTGLAIASEEDAFEACRRLHALGPHTVASAAGWPGQAGAGAGQLRGAQRMQMQMPARSTTGRAGLQRRELLPRGRHSGCSHAHRPLRCRSSQAQTCPAGPTTSRCWPAPRRRRRAAGRCACACGCRA